MRGGRDGKAAVGDAIALRNAVAVCDAVAVGDAAAVCDYGGPSPSRLTGGGERPHAGFDYISAGIRATAPPQAPPHDQRCVFSYSLTLPESLPVRLRRGALQRRRA